MKWLKISNPGSFDVASAVNMLGASVKLNDNPIGMFGSGTKFALAQAVRSGIEMKIYDGERMFNVASSVKNFRDRGFNMVALNALHKRVVTPITTDFGGKDWNDDWFIFREFYSNALDEGNAKLTAVDEAVPIPNETAIYLPYERFKKYSENLEKYFPKRASYTFWVDDGSMYKRNVFIGKMEGTKLCFNFPSFKINECRVMDTYYATQSIGLYLGEVDDVAVWQAVFESTDSFKQMLQVVPTQSNVYKAIHEALVNVYGEKYCICPKVDSIVRDAESMGMTPVVLPEGFVVDSPLLRCYLKMNDTKVIRGMNEEETRKYNTVRNKISSFIPLDLELDIKVFSEGIEEILGDAKIGTRQVRIRDTQFNDEKALMHVIIHEIGHILTLAGDYDRRFTAFFIDKLVEIAN
jgi:hypothetical protein